MIVPQNAGWLVSVSYVSGFVAVFTLLVHKWPTCRSWGSLQGRRRSRQGSSGSWVCRDGSSSCCSGIGCALRSSPRPSSLCSPSPWCSYSARRYRLATPGDPNDPRRRAPESSEAT